MPIFNTDMIIYAHFMLILCSFLWFFYVSRSKYLCSQKKLVHTNFINNFTLNIVLKTLFFKFQTYSVNFVWCWYLICLTSRLWLLNIWFVYAGVKYSPFKWQLSFFLQLHPQLWSLSMLAAFVTSISLNYLVYNFSLLLVN